MQHQFEHLFRTYGASLRRYLTRRGAQPDVAADLTQEAFLQLLRAEPREGLQSPEAYLFRIAANLAVDRHRREARAKILPLDAPEAAGLVDGAPLAERAVLSREELDVLRRAIDDLPPRARTVFMMHKFDGLSYRETADRLGISKNTVMVHMVRALAHCKARLDAYRCDHG